jgi:hypothetical protein
MTPAALYASSYPTSEEHQVPKPLTWVHGTGIYLPSAPTPLGTGSTTTRIVDHMNVRDNTDQSTTTKNQEQATKGMTEVGERIPPNDDPIVEEQSARLKHADTLAPFKDAESLQNVFPDDTSTIPTDAPAEPLLGFSALYPTTFPPVDFLAASNPSAALLTRPTALTHSSESLKRRPYPDPNTRGPNAPLAKKRQRKKQKVEREKDWHGCDVIILARTEEVMVRGWTCIQRVK